MLEQWNTAPDALADSAFQRSTLHGLFHGVKIAHVNHILF